MRFVVDAGVVLRLVEEGRPVHASHRLLAPTLLRSQVLSWLYENGVPRPEAFERLRRIRALRIRLLGDAVLQRNAWEIAEYLGRPTTYEAEYLALTRLQADAFVTLDTKLARQAASVVAVAPFEALTKSRRS